MKKSLFVANSMTISGIVLAIIGVVAIVCGEDFFEHLIQIAGGAIALMSLFMLVMRIAKSKDGDSKLEKSLMIIMFAFALIGGVLLFCFAEQLTRIFAIILGAIILLGAVMMIILTLMYREKGSKLSLVYLISSIVVLIAVGILGFLFIRDPEFGNKVMAIVLGILMILLGLLLLFESFMVRKVIKLFNDNLLTDGQNAEVETVEAEAEVIDEDKPAGE
ncbi:MAG: DUF308 domain-containing protein [Bacteroidales bacterium]|nr:DUF308 domain-containing protein [Bacteroidales bacterium]MBQ1730928.1 DUF308 domain-containing protein [Bacteroidales bacterium]MBQ3832969.1 DUF308 domain-containing protein [Bacteroidales bacterium]MBQ4476782.1 DUF308 domain-containing protein [Bacteroidales bacterium]MBQ5572087.1 DUF308 domain-containing protein [Bacteroidales bacterium]